MTCDFAETYGVLDIEELPPSKAAILFYGLSDDSRIRRKLSGVACSLDTLLLASVADSLSLLVWAKTTDGQKGQNRPPSVLAKLLTSPQEKATNGGFATGEDFDKARNKILKKGG